MPIIEAGGVRTHYDDEGTGAPLVLLHGGLGGNEAWAAHWDALVAAGSRVIGPERRGHGRTADVEGPLTFQLMADDTVAFLDALGAGPAHLVGWSDGAVVGALVAQQRPDLVERLVVIGQYYNSSGKASATFLDDMEQYREDPPDFLHSHYDQVSPDGPGHFRVFLNKSLDMWGTEPELDLAAFAAITAPTLVLQGDDDLVTVEHSAAVAGVIPQARLAVLPGTHGLPVESPDLVRALIVGFLRDEVPGTASWG